MPVREDAGNQDTAAEISTVEQWLQTHHAAVRLMLVRFFQRERRQDPEYLADLTISRFYERKHLIRVENPVFFLFGIRRNVLRESIRWSRHAGVALYEMQDSSPQPPENLDRQERMRRLGGCLQQMPPENRWLLISYSEAGKQKRSAMAEKLGVSLNVLRITICRLRKRLQECMESGRYV